MSEEVAVVEKGDDGRIVVVVGNRIDVGFGVTRGAGHVRWLSPADRVEVG